MAEGPEILNGSVARKNLLFGYYNGLIDYNKESEKYFGQVGDLPSKFSWKYSIF